jgi:hypothetical protein
MNYDDSGKGIIFLGTFWNKSVVVILGVLSCDLSGTDENYTKLSQGNHCPGRISNMHLQNARKNYTTHTYT